jgi:hypothetical protein
MNPDLRNRSVIIALLLAAWAGLIYAKSVLPAFVLADLNSLISYIQVLLGGIVGYHVGSPPTQIAPPRHDDGQGGFASWPLLVVIAAIALALSGCAGTFGHTSYLVTQSASGKGCELQAADGKEFKSRNIAFDGKGCTLVVEEGVSKAFKGQALGVKAINVLPTMGLSDILAPQDQ